MFGLGYYVPLYAEVADEVELVGAVPRGHAMNNIKAFIRDLEAGPYEGLHRLRSKHDLSSGRQRGGLRYTFTITGTYAGNGRSYTEGVDFSCEIAMPDAHIGRVRYVGDNQDPADFLRVKIDGVALTWLDALNHIYQEQKS